MMLACDIVVSSLVKFLQDRRGSAADVAIQPCLPRGPAMRPEAGPLAPSVSPGPPLVEVDALFVVCRISPIRRRRCRAGLAGVWPLCDRQWPVRQCIVLSQLRIKFVAGR